MRRLLLGLLASAALCGPALAQTTTALSADQTFSGAQTFTGALSSTGANVNTNLSPTGTGVVTINPGTKGSIDNVDLGVTTPKTVRANNFTLISIFANSSIPSVSGSGLGTSPTVTGNGTAVVEVTVGSSPSAATFTLTFPATASAGWICKGQDTTTFSTTVFMMRQISYTTTTAVMEMFSTAAASVAPVAGDKLLITCVAR